MTKLLPGLEVVAVGAAIAFGILWYKHPEQNWEPLFGLATLVIVFSEVARRFGSTKLSADRLAEFIEQGQQLRERLNEEPLPVGDHNQWVERMNSYLQRKGGKAFVTRLSDFSAMTFYGDSSEKSEMAKSIDGRVRRLHEFMKEI